VLHILQPPCKEKSLIVFVLDAKSQVSETYPLFLFLFKYHPDTWEKWQSTVKLPVVTFAMNVTVSYKKQKCNSESKYTHRDLSRAKTRGNYKHWLLRLRISSSGQETARDIQYGMQRCWLSQRIHTAGTLFDLQKNLLFLAGVQNNPVLLACVSFKQNYYIILISSRI
jgi:hypothetical protein